MRIRASAIVVADSTEILRYLGAATPPALSAFRRRPRRWSRRFDAQLGPHSRRGLFTCCRSPGHIAAAGPGRPKLEAAIAVPMFAHPRSDAPRHEDKPDSAARSLAKVEAVFARIGAWLPPLPAVATR